MFCIAAFIILGILGIFSAKYRRLAKEAWKCVARRTTFRKCDTNFGEAMKARILGKLPVRRPRLARYLNKSLEVLAFVFVLLTIWSLYMTIHSALNLYVYDTCNPNKPESCSLGAEACSIDTIQPNFWQSARHGHLASWAHRQVDDWGQAFSMLPNRIKKWQPSQYTSSDSSYFKRYDPSKPTALEILDPGCHFCAQLFSNLESANVENRYNLTYIVYPIPDPSLGSGYKFAHSYQIAAYLEAVKAQPLSNASTPADWQIIDRLFTWRDPTTGATYQSEINTFYSDSQTEALITKWLGGMGYSPDQIQAILADSQSQTVKNSIAHQRQVVEKQIKTVKIPTLLLGGRRFDGVVDSSKLGH